MAYFFSFPVFFQILIILFIFKFYFLYLLLFKQPFDFTPIYSPFGWNCV